MSKDDRSAEEIIATTDPKTATQAEADKVAEYMKAQLDAYDARRRAEKDNRR